MVQQGYSVSIHYYGYCFGEHKIPTDMVQFTRRQKILSPRKTMGAKMSQKYGKDYSMNSWQEIVGVYSISPQTVGRIIFFGFFPICDCN